MICITRHLLYRSSTKVQPCIGGMACYSTILLFMIYPFLDCFSFPSTQLSGVNRHFSPSTAFFIHSAHVREARLGICIGRVASKLHQNKSSHHHHDLHDHHPIDCHGLDGTLASQHLHSISSSAAIITLKSPDVTCILWRFKFLSYLVVCFTIVSLGRLLVYFSHDHSMKVSWPKRLGITIGL